MKQASNPAVTSKTNFKTHPRGHPLAHLPVQGEAMGDKNRGVPKIFSRNIELNSRKANKTKKIAPESFPIVRVTWIDAWSEDSNYWRQEQFCSEPDLVITNSGFLVFENKHKIVLAASTYADGRIRNIFVIPRSTVQKVEIAKFSQRTKK